MLKMLKSNKLENQAFYTFNNNYYNNEHKILIVKSNSLTTLWANHGVLADPEYPRIGI